jgi:hypothetical protein
VDPVTHPQPEHPGVELGLALRLRREQQRVPEPARRDVAGGLLPLGRSDPLLRAAHVREHVSHGAGRRRAVLRSRLFPFRQKLHTV